MRRLASSLSLNLMTAKQVLWWHHLKPQESEGLRFILSLSNSSEQVNEKITSTEEDWHNNCHLSILRWLQTEGDPCLSPHRHDPTTHNPTPGVVSFPPTFPPLCSCPPNETDQLQDYPLAGPVSTSTLLSISQGRVISDAWQPGGLFVTVERGTPGQ